MDVIDHQQISALIASYAWHLDHNALDDFVRLFTEDATLHFGEDAKATGRDGIRAAVEGIKQQFPAFAVQHHNTNLHIVAQEDECTAYNYWAALVQPEATSSPIVGAIGHYRTRCVRTEGGWKIAERWIVNGTPGGIPWK